jgi:hypothetical protein
MNHTKIQFIVWDAQSNMFRRDFHVEDAFNDYWKWWDSRF